MLAGDVISKTTTPSDSDYEAFSRLVSERIAALKGPLFTTDATGLSELYLDGLPDNRQHYNCSACKKFINAYGGLVMVDDDGRKISALWEIHEVSQFLFVSLAAMRDVIQRSKVTGVLVNDAPVWGTPKTGVWSHLSGVPALPLHVSKLKTAHQVMAEKGQDFGTLSHGLADYRIDVVRQAVRVLEADALGRSEKTLGVAKWLLSLHERVEGVKGPRRDNLIWSAVATAPPGWCHVRSSMISTLLDDVGAGYPFDVISARWAKKMHPLQYQRPTARPSDGQIAAANAVMDRLPAAFSLSRRFARLEDVVAFWRTQDEPQEAPKAGGGVFDHLRVKRAAPLVELPARTMTWVRFRDEVLPTARRIDVMTPHVGPYYGLVTATDADAPPILQWDGEPRNPVSWYFHVGGSPASRWSLPSGSWSKANALMHKPPHWHHPDKFTHQNEAVFIALDGARPLSVQRGGGLFPECLLADHHGIRSVVEAYTNDAIITGHGEATANGLALQKGDPFNVRVRVNGQDVFIIDRWH